MKPLTRLKTIGLYRLTEDTSVGNDTVKCIRIDNEDIKIFFPADEAPPQNLNATWLGLLENIHDEVPPLNAGKEVIIFRHRDTGVYYWFFVFSTLDKSAIHTKGTHYFRFSNDDEAKELTNDNSYSMLFDNIEKLVSLHTAKNDGEETTWDMKIDTKVGLFEIFDDKGNKIGFDSAAELLSMVFNNDIKLKTKSFNLEASDLTMTASNSVTLNASHFNINNGTENLLSVLTDLLKVLDESVYITPNGTTSDPNNDTKIAYARIKSRLEAYK